MKYKVVWQDEAVANLLTIREGIEEVSQSIETANEIISVIYARTEDLADFPHRYAVYPDRPMLRRMVVRKDFLRILSNH
jgi:plasmid stabilization system protein ParE